MDGPKPHQLLLLGVGDCLDVSADLVEVVQRPADAAALLDVCTRSNVQLLI